MGDTRRDRVLEVSSLSVTYRRGFHRIEAVKDVTFEIAKGEAFGLLGESGSGKSTLALAVLQYLPKTAEVVANSLRFEGTDLRTISKSQLRQLRRNGISAVYQHPGSALNPSMTIGRQLTEVLIEDGGLSAKQAVGLALETLQRVRVRRAEQVLGSYPHELSGGMQQRVVLAMALLSDPSLIVLDEPTTALDANVKADIVALLNELRLERHASFLIISHDVDLIAQTCGRLGVMQNGSLVEGGSVSRVLQKPSHAYTKELILSAPGDRLTKHDGPLGRSRLEHGAGPVRTKVHGHSGTQRVALRCTDVSHSFGDNPVLRNIDIDVYVGETFGLIGESGSGKSTLARILTGLQKPDQGSIELFETEVSTRVERRTRDQRAALQMVFQSPDTTLNPRHRVSRILAGPMKRLARLRRQDIVARIADMISAVRLPVSAADRLPRALSGGQRQRIAIARAFAADPRIVVLDEPTSALDVSVQATVLNLLNELQAERGTAYVFVSHDLKVIRYMADRIGVLYRGRLVEVGTADDIFNGPNHPYTASLLRPDPGRVSADTDGPNADAGCVFASGCPMVMASCRSGVPPDRLDGPSHIISCWREITDLRRMASLALSG